MRIIKAALLVLALLAGDCIVGPDAQAGASRDFDGAADYLSKAAALSQTSPFTLGCWIKADNNAAGVAISIDNGTNSGYASTIYEGTTEGIAAQIVNFPVSQTVIDTHTIHDDGTWQWVSTSWAGSTSTPMYTYDINAGQLSNTLTTTPPNVTRIQIGRVLSTQEFEGSIAHCACWTVQLSEAEDDMLAQGLLPPLVATESLLNYWPIWGESAEPDKHGDDNLTVTSATSSEDGPPVWTP